VRWVNHAGDRELHIHLVGSARPERLRALAARRGHRWAALDEAALRAEFCTGGLLAFIDRYFEAVSLVTHPDEPVELLEDLARDYAAQGVRTAEVMVTPHNLRRVSGLDPEPYVIALADACVALSARHGVALALLLDVVRDEGKDAAREALAWAERFQGRSEGGAELREREFVVLHAEQVTQFRAVLAVADEGLQGHRAVGPGAVQAFEYLVLRALQVLGDVGDGRGAAE
jgi:aminodeoxyfutalosine deaminase